MSDFGLFESDEATQHQPRLAARTAAVRLEAAVDQVRRQFGRFLIAATGIDEFEDRWHLSKNDIRASVEPHVFPNTGTMRRIHNALKADWKLAHPYKLGLSHGEAGFGSMPEGDGPPKNQHLEKTYRPSSGNLIPEGDFEGWKDSVDQGGPEKVQRDFTPGGDSGPDRHARRLRASEDDDRANDEDEWERQYLDSRDLKRDPEDWKDYSDHKEAAALVADIYTDFAQSNGLRVASLDTLDHYASTGIAESDYRLLESMIIRAAEEKEKSEDDDSDSSEDDSDDSSDGGEAPDFGGEDSESGDDDDDSEESDDEDDSSDDDDADDEDYDFGGEEGGQTYTVPEQAPELDPQLMGEIPQDDTDGSAPVPPEVIDSLLGLPEGTIEQLLLEEVEQGQGGSDGFGGGDQGAPQGGGDDFFGGGGGDNTEPPRVARRRQAGGLSDLHRDYGFSVCNVCGEMVDPDGEGHYENPDDPDDYCRARGRFGFRQFWAAPDEDEGDLMARQRQQQRDAIDTKFGPAPEGRPNVQELYRRAQSGDREAYRHLKSLWKERGWTAARRFWAADDNESAENDSSGGGDSGGGQQDPAQDPAAGGMDPAAMGGGMMPPPGSQSVAPPAPPQPIENQPAEDALLDTANQAIMQMIDRETQEYQQIIGPLSQALQAVQFAQQVEQSEHPMDVTPPEGTVNVDPSQAPGGAGNPMQQQARRSAGRHDFSDKHYQDIEDEIREFGDPGEIHVKRPPQLLRNWDGDRAALAEDFGPPPIEPGRHRAMRQAPQQPMQQHASRRIRTARPEVTRHEDGSSTWPCEKCNSTVYRYRGQSDAECNRCNAQYNAFGQRLRDDWRNNRSNYDEDYGDMEGYEDSFRDASLRRRQAKVRHVVRNAAKLIANTYGCSERMLIEAMGRRQYEHVAEAFHILPPQALQAPEVRAAANHIGKMFAAENPMFNHDVWMSSVVGPRTAATGRDRYENKSYSGPRDRHRDEHGKQDLADAQAEDEQNHWEDDPEYRKLYQGSRGRLPFDRPRLAGETWTPTATMDGFEFPNAGQTPRVSDNNPLNDLPGMEGADPHSKKAAASSRAVDRFQRWVNYRQKSGLPVPGGEGGIHNFLQTRNPVRPKVGPDASAMLHQEMGLNPDARPIKNKVPKAVNPTLKPTKSPAAPKPSGPSKPSAPATKKGTLDSRTATWGEWEPTKQASFFTRRVPGWRWDDHLNGYISKEGRAFACSCGEQIPAPSYRNCRCGKLWNVYAIGDTHHLASDSAEMFIAREIPIRPGVVMANKKLADNLDAPKCTKCRGPADLQIFHKCGAPNFRNKYKNESPDSNFACSDCWGNHQKQIDVLLNSNLGTLSYCSACGKDQVSRDHVYAVPLSEIADISGHGWNPDDDQDPFDPRLIGAGRKTAKGDCDCWDGYCRVPGTKPCAEGSCEKCDSHRKESRTRSHAELVAMIDKLADWTKYDDDVDPAVEAYGKNKPPSTNVSKPPKDWARRKPAGDPSKRGGTWTPPTIPRKKK